MGHTSRSWRRHSGYATPAWFGGFGLKTVDDRFAKFGPQNSEEDLRVTRGIIGEFVSRRSIFMNGSWSSDARNSSLPLGLSGSKKKSKGNPRMCNSPISKDRGYPRQPSIAS